MYHNINSILSMRYILYYNLSMTRTQASLQLWKRPLINILLYFIICLTWYVCVAALASCGIQDQTLIITGFAEERVKQSRVVLETVAMYSVSRCLLACIRRDKCVGVAYSISDYKCRMLAHKHPYTTGDQEFGANIMLFMKMKSNWIT